MKVGLSPLAEYVHKNVKQMKFLTNQPKLANALQDSEESVECAKYAQEDKFLIPVPNNVPNVQVTKDSIMEDANV